MEAREEPKVPTRLPRVAGDHAVWYLMNKQIFSSDSCNKQNRFLLGKRVISERLLPAMTEAVKQATGFPNYPEAGRRRRRPDHLAGGERRPRLVGRNHGGLKVMVYVQRGWECALFLTRWDGSGMPVLNGPNYRALRRHCFMEAGDEVENWAFRDEDEKHCFAFVNTTMLSFLSL